MNQDQDISLFIKEIRERFPDVATRIDAWMIHQGLEPEDKMYPSMMEAFSQATTDAIKIQDEVTAREHLVYMSKKLHSTSKIEAEYIDVYYVESLMWDIKDKNIKKWGWSLIPDNLKALYTEVWGEQNF